ncbi:MAG: type I secretion system permease/ATPase [Alphaproteobacteria bacterium]
MSDSKQKELPNIQEEGEIDKKDNKKDDVKEGAEQGQPVSEDDVVDAIKAGQPIDAAALAALGMQPPAPPPPDDSWKLKSSDIHEDAQDPLVSCLVGITRLYGRPLTPDSIKAGLPISTSGMTPAEFVRAATKIDYSARVVRRKLSEVSNYLLPAVLMLRDRSACILTRKSDDEVEIIISESGEGSSTITLEELEERYIGHAIFIKPLFKYDRQNDEKKDEHLFHWFWGTLKKFSKTYSQVAVASVLINLMAIAASLFSLTVYDRVIPNIQNKSAFSTLYMLLIGMGFIVFFDFTLKTLRSYFVDNAGKRADVLLSSKLFEQVLGMRMSARPGSSGGFASRLREYESLREFFTSATMIALIDLPFIFVFLFVIKLIGHQIVYVPLIAIPVVIGLGLLIQFPLRAQIEKMQQQTNQKQGILVETVQGLETIKSLGAEGQMQREWEKFVGASSHSSQRARFVSQLGINIAMSVQQLVTVAVVTTGVFLVEKGEITMGVIIACSILVGRTMAPLAQIAGLLQRLHQSMTSLKHLNEVMNLPVERPRGYEFLSRPIKQGEIEFKDVSFSYPEAAIPALRGVNFKIHPGERVAFLGPIGSGKSTIAKLLIGLYEPTEGAVLLDGTDVRQIDPADIRRSVGSVLQDVLLFHGSVRENISLSAPYADDAMILNAAKMSGADEFISQHPHGYGMQVGEKGNNLSGGQRQSIALARALLTDPQILMMDEPTSMMDMASERQFVERLKRSFHDKTLLVITHRPSLFQAVDRLIVLGQGEVKADGSRDQILNPPRRPQPRTTTQVSPNIKPKAGGKAPLQSTPIQPKAPQAQQVRENPMQLKEIQPTSPKVDTKKADTKEQELPLTLKAADEEA